MKTNLHLTHVVALAIAVMAALAQPVFGIQINNQLVFTEDSTGLSVTYNGAPLIVTSLGGTGGTQHWLVTTPVGVTFTSAGVSWTEPENSSLFNNVAFTNPTASVAGPTLPVASDVVLPFTTIIGDEMPFQVGHDLNGVPVMATFDDDGEPKVPDTGSTLSLLALALAALFGASRLRSIRAV
jgi:hypothetical protein